jgi:PAS domain S-box-containing protein
MEAVLASTLSQAQDGAAVLDRGGAVRFVNATFCRLVKLDEEDLLGRRLLRSSLVPLRPVRRAIVAHLRRGAVWRGELALPGASLAEVSVSALHPQRGYHVSVRDITERRRVEEIAASINLTDNLGMIFAGLRHELGNPINSLKTALHVTRDNLDRFDREKLAYYIERMIGEVSRVEYLLRSLRSFGALDVPELTSLELDDFFASFIELVRRDLSAKDIAFECVSQPGLRVHADPRALHQVLLNLVNNAAQALEHGERRHLAMTARRLDKRVEIAISDTGVGMNDSQLAHLFQPFHTTKRDGTGMGLVIVRRLVSQMRGTIACTSEPGRGTTMRVLLEAP